MATLRPFRALRPARDKAALVSAVPYDVVTKEEARALAADNPLSFLHVSRAEIDLPDGLDPHADAVYAKAADSFAWLRRQAPLIPEAYPALYVYRLRSATHEQTGVAGVSSLDEYESGVIKKHELTRPDKENDRTRHILAVSAQTGPVFLTYRGRGAINTLVAAATKGEPLFSFVAPDAVAHTVWRLNENESRRLSEAFAEVPSFYIADGHHRAAGAARVRAKRKSENRGHTGSEDYNFFLTVLFPADQVRVLPYNRVVKDLNGRTPEAFLTDLSRRAPLSEKAPASPTIRGFVSVYAGGRWRGLRLPRATRGGSVSRLDADLLQDHVLDPVLGIKDVRTDKRIEFIGGVRGPDELQRLVDSGQAAAAFSMYPVSLDELMATSDAGRIMPPKSTWFEPKLRDGLLIHQI